MGKREQPNRNCSVCKQSGHIDASCASHQESASGKAHVFVNTHAPTEQSAHVIDLTPGHDTLEQAPIFAERKKRIAQIAVVDFAAAVREANKPKEVVEVVVPVVESRVRRKGKAPAFAALNIHTRKKGKPVRERRVREPRKIRIPRPHMPELRIVHAVSISIATVLLFFGATYVSDVKATSERVALHAAHAFEKLQSSTAAALRADAPSAQADLADALAAFADADALVETEHTMLQTVATALPIVGPQVEGRKTLLQAGQHIALGNSYVIRGVQAVQNDTLTQTDRLEVVRDHLRAAQPQYAQAVEEFARVPSSVIPTTQQQAFREFQLLFTTFVQDMDELSDLMDALAMMLGTSDFKRYLVVFQNERELRPTGGFIGSFAVCDVQKGKFLGCEIPGGGSYDLKGQLSQYVIPPEPLQLVNGRWEFQDSNWWPDFPASAQKMMWFYENSRDTTVDGVIAINADMLERFLSLVGPVVNEEFAVALHADTALNTIQEKVELDYDREENKPKAIIGSLAEQFVAQINTFRPQDFMALVSLLHEGANKKDVQLYLADANVQRTFSQFGWTGEVLQTTAGQDYLQVVSANIAGQKSDERMVQGIQHDALIQEDGSVIARTTITKEHTGRPGEQFYGGPNISYMRVYVPKGAVLLDASGFTYPPEDAFKVPETWYKQDSDIQRYEHNEEIHLESGTRVTEQFGKTVFGNWMVTLPGETQTITFTYQLPFRMTLPQADSAPWYDDLLGKDEKEGARYTLVAQSQSGIDATFSSRVTFPAAWSPTWQSRTDIDLDAHAASLETILDHDVIMGIVVQRDK